jgi:Heterokaryon incompatibility protein (HET)
MAGSNASKLPGFNYQPLQNPESLRLLKLQPGSETAEDINCELIEVPPDNPISYEAVSWTWGAEKWTKSVRINHKDQAFSFDISPNLASAMMALRLPGEVRILWIDAICIDQKNGHEKNQQVPMMSRIYGQASRVCIWLGEGTEDTKLALDFIKKEVLELWEFDRLCENLDKSKRWAALIDLMKQPWFSRRWVVQEIALANKGLLYCGKETIDWQEFADAVSLFVQVETATHRLSEVMKRSAIYNHAPDFFGEIPALGASLLVEATSNLFRRSKEGVREPLLSLEYLVSTLSVFKATDPRDTVFALLAIAKDTSPRAADQQMMNVTLPGFHQLSAWSSRLISKTYHVDYEKPVVETYKDFVAFAIRQAEQTRALDIICEPWAPPLDKGSQRNVHGWRPLSQTQGNDEELPSWIASSDGAAFGMNETTSGAGRKMGRMNADPLVGLPGERNYSAAGTRNVSRSVLKIKKRATYYSMYVEGFILDRIGETQEVARHGNIPATWLSFGGWDRQEDDPPQEFWRTVIANRGSNGRNAPTSYPRACKESIRKGMRGGALDGTDLINNGRCSIVAEFLRRLQAVIWNRRLCGRSCAKETRWVD